MIQCKSMIFLVYIGTSKFNQSDWRISIMWSKLTNHKARIFIARNLPKNQQTMEYPAIWLVEFALKKKLKWKFLKIIFPFSSSGLLWSPLFSLSPPSSLGFFLAHFPSLAPFPLLFTTSVLSTSPLMITRLLSPFRLAPLTFASVYLLTCLLHLHICTFTFCHSEDTNRYRLASDYHMCQRNQYHLIPVRIWAHDVWHCCLAHYHKCQLGLFQVAP